MVDRDTRRRHNKETPVNRVAAPVIALVLLAAWTPSTAQAPPAKPAFNPSLVMEPFKPAAIYGVGEPVGWHLYAPLGGTQRFAYTVRENNAKEIASGIVDVTSGRGQVEARLDHPGMVYLRLTPLDGDRPMNMDHVEPALLDRLTAGAAVAPAAIEPATPRPSDFDAFWAAQLARLAKVPVNPRLQRVPSASTRVDLASVTLDSVGGHVRGYLARPTGKGRFPALLVFQWAGVYPLQADWAVSRAAEGWLTFDVSAHDMALTEATVPQDYPSIGAGSRDTSYFLNMYLRDTRALQYLRSRPDWDGHTLVLMGTSMGGQQSFATAGLNPGLVTAVLVNVPAGADVASDDRGRRAGYPNWNTRDPRVAATAPYFDPVNFASRITAPTLAGIGFIDTTSPPAGIYTVLNQIKASTEAVPMPESDHNNVTPQKEGAFYRRASEMLDALRNGQRNFIHHATGQQGRGEDR